MNRATPGHCLLSVFGVSAVDGCSNGILSSSSREFYCCQAMEHDKLGKTFYLITSFRGYEVENTVEVQVV